MFSYQFIPETQWANNGQVEVGGKLRIETEPMFVEKNLDDLLLGVKGESNWDIAGSLRNLFSRL